MEMPLSVEESLKLLVELLIAIGEALGANVQHIKDFNTEASKMPDIPNGGGARNPGRGSPEDIGAQVGFHGTVLEPISIKAGEIGAERVDISPGGGSGSSGAVNVTLELDGTTIGKIFGNMSKDGRIRIHESSIRSF